MLESRALDERPDAAFPAGGGRLRVQLRHRIGALRIDVDFQLTQPWTILFGASGSGKTTILRAIAGLLRPEFGQIVYSKVATEERVTLVDTAAGIFLPAHRRRTPLAAQQPNLFPHKKVQENLGYGVETDDLHPSSAAVKAQEEMLDLFGLTSVSDRLPSEISGGEAQRVNLARAVAVKGSRVLLLDEPFTGMDGARRGALLPELRDRLANDGRPVLSVTHDVAEAFQLGAEVILISEGKIVRQGPVEVVLAEERARMLAHLSP